MLLFVLVVPRAANLHSIESVRFAECLLLCGESYLSLGSTWLSSVDLFLKSQCKHVNKSGDIIYTNAQMTARQTRIHCALLADAARLLEGAK